MNDSTLTEKQIADYYAPEKAARAKAQAAAKTMKVVYFILFAVVVAFGIVCASIAVSDADDKLSGTNVSGFCIGDERYSAKVPASYNGDIVAYKNDGGHVNPMVKVCP